MRIGEWDGIGRARALIVHQLGELGAVEYAAHVTMSSETGKQRIFVATDIGLMEYSWSGEDSPGSAPWTLRGSLVRWASVRGLRLQTDGQWEPSRDETKQVWRLVAEEPRLELKVASDDAGDRTLAALLAFARACLERAG